MSRTGRHKESVLPEGKAVIIDFNPAAVLDSSSPLMAMLLELNEVDPESGIDSAVESFREETGIDLRSVTYAEMFMDLDALLETGIGTEEESGEPNFGVALYGEFEEAEVIASFESAPDVEYEVSEYQGYDVYILYDEFGDAMSVAFIGTDAVLIGTESSVEAMLDVSAGAASPASGELRQALDSLGERHMGFAMALPPELLEEMMGAGGEGAMPEMGLLGALDLGALTAPLSAMKLLLHDDAIEIEAVSFFDDNAAATASKEYSEGVVAMFGLMASESPELQEFASGMEVGQDGNAVTFSMTISSAAIEQLFAGLGMGMMPPQN